MKHARKRYKAKKDGISYKLSFLAFCNMHRAKRCYYTGMLLTDPLPKGKHVCSSRTIERTNPDLGYEHGNVHAVCVWANLLLGVIDNPNNELELKHLYRLVEVLKKARG
jgi:hypothetical protein